MEIIMSKKKMLTKVEICEKYEIKASKLEYHIKKDSFPKGEIINGLRHFSETELKQYAKDNKAFRKPSAIEIGKAEAEDYNNTTIQPENMLNQGFRGDFWLSAPPKPWYIRQKLLVKAVLTAIVAGTAAAILSSIVG